MDVHKGYALNVRGRLFDLSRPKVMGIVNCTPDSFYPDKDEDVWGADILDIGAYSTRPGHGDVSEDEEMRRLAQFFDEHHDLMGGKKLLSVDTFRASVARVCVEKYGVGIVNDVSGGKDREMFRVVTELRVPYILTHSETYCGMAQMLKDLIVKVQMLRDMGNNDIIIDPGFGFGKTLEDNYDVMTHLEQLLLLDLPILVGVSRKSMIQKVLDCDAEHALNGTTVLNTLALEKGANILRVHDVKAAREVIDLLDSLG